MTRRYLQKDIARAKAVDGRVVLTPDGRMVAGNNAAQLGSRTLRRAAERLFRREGKKNPSTVAASQAKRQTLSADGVTGTRYCKRCSGHRKSDGGTHLTDGISRRSWACQACTEGYHAQRASSPSAGIESSAGRAQA